MNNEYIVLGSDGMCIIRRVNEYI